MHHPQCMHASSSCPAVFATMTVAHKSGIDDCSSRLLFQRSCESEDLHHPQSMQSTWEAQRCAVSSALWWWSKQRRVTHVQQHASCIGQLQGHHNWVPPDIQ